MDRYAVMGNPVAHSKSPAIHAMFAEQTGETLSYERILAPLDGFSEALAKFAGAGGKGLNITVPFKQEAWAAVAERSERAEAAGAVNTILLRPDGRHYGDNTDGAGLVRDLRDNNAAPLSQRRILILGAGGAVRGVMPSILQEIPAEITVANRTRAKAELLAERFGGSIPVQAKALEELQGERFDIVVNGTSASLGGAVPTIPSEVAEGAICYDMVYGDEPTAFLRWAMQHGAAKALDGLGMLVEQAAESFYLWRGKSPDTAPVIAALRHA